MSDVENRQLAHWEALAYGDPDSAVIDPNDRRGFKNAYLAGIRDNAFNQSLDRYGIRTGVLLDVGCGTGSAMLPLLDQGHRIVGIDISTGLLRHAQARCLNRDCLFVATDGKRLPLADGAVDATIIYVVLSYLVEEAKALELLASIRSTLKPGSPLIMIEQVRVHSRITEQGLKMQRSLRQWKDLLESAGFLLDRATVLRHGRFPTTPMIRAGWLPRKLWPGIRRLEAAVAARTGVFPWDYAEVLFEARA